jgi:hypothetical protein
VSLECSSGDARGASSQEMMATSARKPTWPSTVGRRTAQLLVTTSWPHSHQIRIGIDRRLG